MFWIMRKLNNFINLVIIWFNIYMIIHSFKLTDSSHYLRKIKILSNLYLQIHIKWVFELNSFVSTKYFYWSNVFDNKFLQVFVDTKRHDDNLRKDVGISWYQLILTLHLNSRMLFSRIEVCKMPSPRNVTDCFSNHQLCWYKVTA